MFWTSLPSSTYKNMQVPFKFKVKYNLKFYWRCLFTISFQGVERKWLKLASYFSHNVMAWLILWLKEPHEGKSTPHSIVLKELS